MKKYPTFEFFPEKISVIPTRSSCYNITPYNLGNVNIESLTSYIHRLARAHKIYPGVFIKFLLCPLIYKIDPRDRSAQNRIYKLFKASYSINGFKKIAKDISFGINSLTNRKDISSLTMINFTSLLTINDISPIHKWCPRCIQESKEENHEIYEKLIWSLNVVTICNIHKCKLISNCRSCGETVRNLDAKTILGYCSNCNNFLGLSNVPDDLKVIKKEYVWHEWVYENLNLLFTTFYSNENVIFDYNIFLKNINFIFKNRIQTKKHISEILNVNRHVIVQWLHGKLKISLFSLLKISFCLKINLVTLLNEIVFDTTKFTYNRKIPITEIKPNTFKKVSVEELSEFLDNIINSKEFPPPKLEDVVNRLGYKSIESVRYYFPEKCKVISQKHKEYRKQTRIEREKKNAEKIKSLIEYCAANNIYPSVKYLERELNLVGLFLNKDFKDLRFQLMQSFGIDPKRR